jgi:hypothetical protein
MPATSIRDLIVKDDDLVVATHGHGFWILDDITPLHQIDPRVAEADLHVCLALLTGYDDMKSRALHRAL